MELNMEVIRRMPEIQAIAEYLRNISFKRRVFGGVDTEDVLDKLSDVSLQFEAIISVCMAQCKQHADRIFPLELQITQMEQESEYYRELAQWHEGNTTWLQAQNDQLRQQANALWVQLEQGRQAESYAPCY